MVEVKNANIEVCPPEFDPATVFAQSYCRHRKDLNEVEAKSFFVEVLKAMESLKIDLTRDSFAKNLKGRKVKSPDSLAKTLLEDYEALLQQKYAGYILPSDELIKYTVLLVTHFFSKLKEGGDRLELRGRLPINIPFFSHLRLAIALLASRKNNIIIWYDEHCTVYDYFPKLASKSEKLSYSTQASSPLLPKVVQAFAKLYEERKEIYESPLILAPAIAQAENFLAKNDFFQTVVWCDKGLAADPKNVFLLLTRSTAKMHLGQLKEAGLDCDEAIRLNPKSDEAWSQRAGLKFAAHDLDGAILDAHETLKLNPENEIVFGYLQEAKIIRGQYAEIIQECDQYLKKYPEKFLALTYRARAKLRLKFFAEAIRDCDAAIKMYGAYDEAWRCRGHAKMALQYFADAITDFNEVIKLEPKDSSAWYQRGMAKLTLGRDEEAIQDLSETIKLNPTYASAWCGRAMVKQKLGRHQSAIQDLDEALKLDHKDAVENAFAWCLRGELKLRMGWHKDALYDLNQAVKLNPQDDHAWELLGKVKHLLGSYEEAIQDATQALTLNPKNDTAWWIRADCNLRLNNHAKAMEDLNQVLRLNPKNDIAWNDRGLIKYTLDLYEEAVKDLSEAIKLNPKNEMRWRMRGLAQCDLGRYKEAIQDFNEALKLDSKNVLGWRWRGEAKAKLNRYEEAIQDLSKALELEPGNVDIESQIVELGKELDQIFPAQAQMYYESEQYREAISCCDKVLAVQPDNLKILQIRGESHAKLRHHREAIQDFNKVILLDPIHEAALVYRGVARQSLGQNKEAVDDLTKAIALNASLDYAWMFRGVAQQSLGCLEESFEDLSEAVRLNPQSNFANKKLKEVNGILINTWKNKATQYFKTKEYEETIFYCDKVILENPEDVAMLQLCGESKLKLGRYKDAIQDLMEVMRLNPENTYVKECLKEARRNLKDESQTSTSALPPKLSATSQDSPVFSHAIKFSMAIPKDQLVFEKKLGEGSFGEVHKGIWSPTSLYQVPVAIKRLKNAALSVKSLEEFRKEVEIQAKLNSVGVVKLMGITAEQPYCMVMEFMEQGSLRDVLDSQKPEELQWSIRIQMAINMARGLAYLHEHDPIIIHGDLKSLNILVNGRGEAKLADFGLAALKTETRSREYVEGNAETNKGPKGSLLWIAPELFRMNAKRTPATDVFSFAVVLWELASHLFPYESAQGDSHRIQDWVEKGERESFDERTPNTPKEYSDLTQRCWDGKPENRPSAKSIVVELEALYASTPLAPTLFSSVAQPSSPKVPVKKPANLGSGGYLVKSANPLTKSKTGSPKVPPRKSLVGSGNYLVKSTASSSTSSPASSPQVPPKSPYMGNVYK